MSDPQTSEVAATFQPMELNLYPANPIELQRWDSISALSSNRGQDRSTEYEQPPSSNQPLLASPGVSRSTSPAPSSTTARSMHLNGVDGVGNDQSRAQSSLHGEHSLHEGEESARLTTAILPPQSAVSAPPPNLDNERVARKVVKWGYDWKQPSLMLLMLLLGLGFAVGHHFYYAALSGSTAGSSAQQQWPVRFGTAFAFLTAAALGATCSQSYNQYFWVVVSCQSHKLSTVEKLFSLGSDPTSLVSWEVISQAKIAVLMALVCSCITFSSIAPPATLTVVPSYGAPHTTTDSVPTFNWNLVDFSQGNVAGAGTANISAWILSDITIANLKPSTELSKIAFETAESMEVEKIPGPHANSSYTTQFYGPTVTCNTANSSQLAVFAQTQFNQGTSTGWHFFSAFWAVPQFYETLLNVTTNEISVVDPPTKESIFNSVNNNWPNASSSVSPNKTIEQRDEPLQLFVQTQNSTSVCTLQNASFEIEFEYVNSVQSIKSRNIIVQNDIYMPTLTCANQYTQQYWTNVKDPCISIMAVRSAYASVFIALSNLLVGDVTAIHDHGDATSSVYAFGEVTSQVVDTGLPGCQDFRVQNRADYQNAYDNTGLEIFQAPDFVLCRNKTVPLAIQDLMNNLTISMLAASDTTIKIPASVKNWTIISIYEYDAFLLLLSYGLGILATAIVLCIGLWALYYNGVAHSNSFTEIIATTRNVELDELCNGNSLGAIAEDKKMKRLRLRFGALIADADNVLVGGKVVQANHVAFGKAEGVVRLRRGGIYC